MKRLFAIAVLVLVLVLVLQLVSFACTPPPPPPPPTPEPADCSPGYWKNHTDWMLDTQWANPGLMLEKLRAKGNSPLRPFRQPTADELNAAYPSADCD